MAEHAIPIEHDAQTDSYPPKVRILQVVSGLDCGGVETWLLNVVRKLDRHRFQIDFLVHTPGPHALEDEFRALGCHIHPGMNPRRISSYIRNLSVILQRNPRYTVVHCHLLFFSGLLLPIAWMHGIPIRVAHSHSDSNKPLSLFRAIRLSVLRMTIHLAATHKLAASESAATFLYGTHSSPPPEQTILHCGIDLTLYEDPGHDPSLRDALGIPHDAVVVGHVGSMRPVKNHDLILNIARRIHQQEEDAIHFVLVGDGPLRPQIEKTIAAQGLSDVIHLTGVRDDVPSLMLHCFSMFLFPSRHEGLGLVGIEAQAAGLPCLFSDAIPMEACVVRESIARVRLDAPLEEWVQFTIRQARKPRTQKRSTLHARIRESGFDIQSSTSALQDLYSAQPGDNSR